MEVQLHEGNIFLYMFFVYIFLGLPIACVGDTKNERFNAKRSGVRAGSFHPGKEFLSRVGGVHVGSQGPGGHCVILGSKRPSLPFPTPTFPLQTTTAREILIQDWGVPGVSLPPRNRNSYPGLGCPMGVPEVRGPLYITRVQWPPWPWPGPHLSP